MKKHTMTVPQEHCGARLFFFASFMAQYGWENRPHVGNTARCEVCQHWFGYYYVGPRDYLIADGSTQEAVWADLGAIRQ